jgi:hypothetical protein
MTMWRLQIKVLRELPYEMDEEKRPKSGSRGGGVKWEVRELDDSNVLGEIEEGG